MVKSISVGRAVADRAQLQKAAEFLRALGVELESSSGAAQHRGVTFSAPAGRLTLGWEKGGEAPKSHEHDLLLEVSDPDVVFEIAQERGMRVQHDEVIGDGDARLIVLDVPGLGEVAIFGRHEQSQSGMEGALDARGRRFAIVVSRFNAFITDRLLDGAMQALRQTGAERRDVRIVRVPGAFEIPTAARALAESGKYDAIVCLGCLLRGGTLHYEVICNEVARGIGQSAQETGVPHGFGVLTCDTLEQAIDRAGLKAGNKGFEAALAAVEMASLKKEIGVPQKKVRPIIKKKPAKAASRKR